MKTSLRFVLFASITLATGSANAEAPMQASSVEHFTGRCLDAAHSDGKDVNCEISAVAKVGNRLFFANDKPIPGNATSSLFSIGVQEVPKLPLEFEHLTFQGGKLFEATEKLEGLTKVSFDATDYAMATNAFTKASNSASSRILYWPVDKPDEAKILGDPQELQQRIGEQLRETFFQVEGIAVDHDKNLLLGIRKLGADSKKAKPDFIILRAPIKTLAGGEIVLGNEFEQAYRFTPNVPGDDRPLALSGLEYDPYNRRLLATTSHEDGEKIGGYLWSLPLSLLQSDPVGTPQPILGTDGQPLWFDNKPEGVEVLSESQVLVVHDDDRVQVVDSEKGKSKKVNEFAYSVVTFGKDNASP
ncbi:hypothetical protein ACIQUF_10180 [Pseudomonas sp. NPDC090233]|uniref:hypothetical protein n=1 Tax=Pseudomonas sp. NPDC090233 TaxID=3364479 RepID=UPI00383B9323